jgi:UPF0716 family protein affecting phage T7 exclusion
MGFLRSDLSPARRVLLAVAALALLMPGWVSDLGGLVVFVGLSFKKGEGRGESEAVGLQTGSG